MLIAGIDEAGRGPVIGPMVIVGIAVQNTKLKLLEELGVKDSKQLNFKERENIYNSILKISDKYLIKIISPQKIDEYVFGNKLNILEFEIMADIINGLQPDIVYIDSPSRNTKMVTEYIFSKINNRNIKIVAENKADSKYPVVSASSIVAKVIRDREIQKIKKLTGIDFGSGYPSDPKTREAISKYYKELQNYIRKSWKTIRDAKQKNLLEFI
ncbi:MAG TPA: ribonuclease HII [Candidatus Nanopusillus sp.]|nr:ribonuclease HII [Candidatus Nanopusillus sp.]HIP89977.1 ribonuclease HII [Candidatus Nanopusillus sp.]